MIGEMQSFFEKIYFLWLLIIDLLGVVVTPVGHDWYSHKKGAVWLLLNASHSPHRINVFDQWTIIGYEL